uniref:Integral membrane protein 2 n=1 Tax=Cacopsylla melanoneura TaxID=428564 RepID=A0A8D8RPT9_9HEMI
MTVIKAFSNDKVDKKPTDNQPLVVNDGIPDVEAGAEEEPQADPRLLMMRVRAKRASTITTLVLIVASALVFTIALCGAFYIYKQFLHVKHLRYRTTCYVPYYEDGDDLVTHNGYQERWMMSAEKSGEKFIEASQEEDVEAMSMMKQAKDMARAVMDQFRSAPLIPLGKSFREEFESDSNGVFEKMSVPEFERGRNSKFIHDFSVNMTGIIDIAGERCFVMPLDRTVVLPPQSLKDLIEKMAHGYYTINPSQLSETYRALEIPVDADTLGPHITQACDSYPIYKLEKLVSGVAKKRRSVDVQETVNKAFTVLDGMQPRSIEIVNIESLPQAVQK